MNDDQIKAIFEEIVTDEEPQELEVPEKRATLLEVWRSILENIEAAEKEPITPSFAARVVGGHAQITVQEVFRYRTIYSDRLREFRDILDFEIESDPDCLKFGDEDAEVNGKHYLNLLISWQLLCQSTEEEWDSTSAEAHLEMAAYVDATNFVLGNTGMIAHLDQIGFTFDEDDAKLVYAALSGGQEE